jgi:hypothetical protein
MEALVTYVHNRLDSLIDCNSRFEDDLDKDVQEIINPNGTAAEHLTDAMKEEFKRIDYHLRDEFRRAMYVSVCTFLNELVVAYVKQAVSEYWSKLQKNGSEIAANLNLLRNECDVDFGSSAQEAEDHNLVRNCVVHTWCNLNEFRGRDRLREAIDRLKQGDEYAWTINGNCLIANEAVCMALTTCLDLRDILRNHFMKESG